MLLGWAREQSLKGNDAGSAVKANSGAEQLVLSFMDGLSHPPPAPLMAVLSAYEKRHGSISNSDTTGWLVDWGSRGVADLP